jgi:16S rRNA A1518/A1519 N6-dimethyltransferase RsmA/KsgA/DIM1 with predicted DNA glycosylase/AP lyase activity
MLRRSLKQLQGFEEIAKELPFDFSRRPEELTPVKFVQLTNAIHEAWKN